MDAAKKLAGKTYRHFMHDSLYRNSIFIMLNTAILAGFGFFFWVLAAHFYSTNDVGIAATILSAAGLVCALGMLGFDSALIHFIPGSKNINEQIDTAFSIACLTSCLIIFVYLIAIKLWVPKLHFLSSESGWLIIFVIFAVAYMLNSLTNNVFIAKRTSHVILAVNTLFSFLRLGLMISFERFKLVGLVASNLIATLIALGLTFYLFKKRIGYIYKFRIVARAFKAMRGFALANYLYTVVSNLPLLILPTLVVSILGAKESAFFYIVTVLVGVLYIIPAATAQSLFAEGSWEIAKIEYHLIRATKIIALLMVPAVVVFLFGGRFILKIFGGDYASQSYTLLILMTLAGIPKAITYLLSTVLRVQKNITPVNILYIFYTVFILLGSYVGLRIKKSLNTIGIVILLAETILALLYVGYIIVFSRRLIKRGAS